MGNCRRVGNSTLSTFRMLSGRLGLRFQRFGAWFSKDLAPDRFLLVFLSNQKFSVKNVKKRAKNVQTHNRLINSHRCKLNKTINWKITFAKVQKIAHIKLKWFKIRLVQRIMATNVMLLNMGVVANNLCSFCEQERDSLEHYVLAM